MDSNGTTTTTTNKRFHFEFLLPFLLRPGASFQKIVQKRATWLTPLLVISLLTIARVMLAAPTAVPARFEDPSAPPPGQMVPGKGQAPQGDIALVSAGQQKGGGGGEGEGVPPGAFPEQTGGSMLGNILPAIAATISIWVGWFLLSVLLYVGMVVSGSNNSFIETLNLTSWASLPFALRQIVMLIAALAMPSLSSNPGGLAALTSSMGGPLGMFLAALLKSVDIYLIWQMILIVVGLRQVSPLPLPRIVGITLGAMALYLLLAALPGFLGAILAQLTAPVPTGF